MVGLCNESAVALSQKISGLPTRYCHLTLRHSGHHHVRNDPRDLNFRLGRLQRKGFQPAISLLDVEVGRQSVVNRRRQGSRQEQTCNQKCQPAASIEKCDSNHVIYTLGFGDLIAHPDKFKAEALSDICARFLSPSTYSMHFQPVNFPVFSKKNQERAKGPALLPWSIEFLSYVGWIVDPSAEA